METTTVTDLVSLSVCTHAHVRKMYFVRVGMHVWLFAFVTPRQKSLYYLGKKFYLTYPKF